MREVGFGFSFAGHHVSEFGVALANNDESMNLITDDVTYKDTEISGAIGDYPMGCKINARVFKIKLLAEKLTMGKLEAIGRWLAPDAVGELSFDHTPYKYYVARVTTDLKPPAYTKYDEQNHCFVYDGTIEFSFTAFRPRAYLYANVASGYALLGNGNSVVDNDTGLVAPDDMPFLSFANPASGDGFLLLNAGTARAALDVTLVGVLNGGVKLENATTEQSFTVTTGDATARTVNVLGSYGRVTESISGTDYMADQYKAGSYIDLVPSAPVLRGVPAAATTGSAEVTVPSTVAGVAGKHILLDKWYKISSQNGATLTLSENVETGGSYAAVVARMNELTLTGSGVTALSFSFKHTFY